MEDQENTNIESIVQVSEIEQTLETRISFPETEQSIPFPEKQKENEKHIDYNLHAFKRIVDFIKSLHDEFSHLKNHARFKPLALYHRLITNSKYANHNNIMDRHLQAFRQFCSIDFDSTAKPGKIHFNDRIYIDMDFFIAQSSDDTKQVIYSYLTIIKSLLNGHIPESEQQNISYTDNIPSIPSSIPDMGQLAGLFGNMASMMNTNTNNLSSLSSSTINSSMFTSMTDDQDIIKILQSPVFEKVLNNPMVQGLLSNPIVFNMLGSTIGKVSSKKKEFVEKIEKMDIDTDRVINGVFKLLKDTLPMIENTMETEEDVKYILSLLPEENVFISMFKEHYNTIKTSMEEWKEMS